MIGRLRGKLLTQEADRVLVETPGGVGYEVLVAPRTLINLPVIDADVTLHIETKVREDAITLYGFLDVADRTVFRALQTVTGIGPKLALAVVGTTEPAALVDAIAREDIPALVKIPGLGKKTAARLCLELKDRLDLLLGGATLVPVAQRPAGSAKLPPAVEDATGALAALGYNNREIQRALKLAAHQPDDTVQSLLKRSLKALSPA